MVLGTAVIDIGGAVAAEECTLDGDVFQMNGINKEYKFLWFTNQMSESPEYFFPFCSKDGKKYCIAYGAVTETGTPIALVKACEDLKRMYLETFGEGDKDEN